MAAEIRDLENQLYEYDHEYRLLEQELETLRHQNAALKSATPPPADSKRSLFSPAPSSRQTPGTYELQPRDPQFPIAPEPILNPPERQTGPESILEQGDTSSRSPSAEEMPPPQAGRVPLPSDRPATGTPVPPERLPTQPPTIDPSGAASPSRAASPGNAAPSGPTFPGSNSPSLRNPNLPQPGSTPRNPALPKLPAPKNDFDSEELLSPPTIDLGVPSPPPLPVVTQKGDGTPVSPENNLEMNLSRIEIPSQRTAAQLASNASVNQATLQIAKEKVTDTRVVELAFHPTLSRAIDMDDRPDDDGLYLVLQPKNERGQMVAVAADLTIFVLDPAREGDAAKIGRWEYSAADVQAKLKPIGSEQGIHFRLPWNGPDPSADRVIVFALFKFENGRQVMGEKEIFISSDGSHKTVWTAREADRSQVPQVSPAGYTTPSGAGSAGGGLSAAGFSASQPVPTNVVRPASGTSAFEPAPQPR